MRSLHRLPWSGHPGVSDRLYRLVGYTLPFGFDDLSNVGTTLGEHVVGLRFKEAKHKVSGSSIKGVFGDRELESSCDTRYDEILIRGSVRRVEFSLRDPSRYGFPPTPIYHRH